MINNQLNLFAILFIRHLFGCIGPHVTAAATTESISDVQSYSSHYEGVTSCPTDLSLDPTTVPSADDVAGAPGNSTSYTFCVNTDQSTATIQNSVLSTVQDVQPVEGLTSTLASDDVLMIFCL